jgi:hypothetical protein
MCEIGVAKLCDTQQIAGLCQLLVKKKKNLHEHESRKKISTPETNILLEVSGGNGRQTTNVDTPVEHVENLLVTVKINVS